MPAQGADGQMARRRLGFPQIFAEKAADFRRNSLHSLKSSAIKAREFLPVPKKSAEICGKPRCEGQAKHTFCPFLK